MTPLTDVDAAQFRHLCGHFITGVVIVTMRTADGNPIGMTANSFASVSLEPPLVSVNIDRAAEIHDVILGGDMFALNILANGQEELSRRFAEPQPDPFDGIGYAPNEHGIPLLHDVLAVIECRRHSTFAAGDHTIIVGRVVGGRVGQGRPLMYFRGGYQDFRAG